MKKMLITIFTLAMICSSSLKVWAEDIDWTSTQEVKLEKGQNQFEVKITIDEPNAYAGAEFGIQAPEGVNIKSVKYNVNGSKVEPTEARGLTWFSYYSGNNDFEGKTNITMTLEYKGTNNTSLVIDNISLYTKEGTVVDTEKIIPRKVVEINRAGATNAVDPLEPPIDNNSGTDGEPSDNNESSNDNESSNNNSNSSNSGTSNTETNNSTSSNNGASNNTSGGTSNNYTSSGSSNSSSATNKSNVSTSNVVTKNTNSNRNNKTTSNISKDNNKEDAEDKDLNEEDGDVKEDKNVLETDTEQVTNNKQKNLFNIVILILLAISICTNAVIGYFYINKKKKEN